MNRKVIKNKQSDKDTLTRKKVEGHQKRGEGSWGSESSFGFCSIGLFVVETVFVAGVVTVEYCFVEFVPLVLVALHAVFVGIVYGCGGLYFRLIASHFLHARINKMNSRKHSLSFSSLLSSSPLYPRLRTGKQSFVLRFGVINRGPHGCKFHL